MKKLGDFEIPNGAQCPQLYQSHGVQAATVTTNAGRSILYSQKLIKGRQLTVLIDGVYAVITHDQLKQIESMSLEVGKVYVFEWLGEILAVNFDFTSNQAWNFNPIFGYVYHDNPEKTIFSGQINLIEV